MKRFFIYLALVSAWAFTHPAAALRQLAPALRQSSSVISQASRTVATRAGIAIPSRLALKQKPTLEPIAPAAALTLKRDASSGSKKPFKKIKYLPFVLGAASVSVAAFLLNQIDSEGLNSVLHKLPASPIKTFLILHILNTTNLQDIDYYDLYLLLEDLPDTEKSTWILHTLNTTSLQDISKNNLNIWGWHS